MWIIYLEAGFALALAIFIVWWTWPKKKPAPPPAHIEDAAAQRNEPPRHE